MNYFPLTPNDLPKALELLHNTPADQWKQRTIALYWIAHTLLTPFSIRTITNTTPQQIYDQAISFAQKNTPEQEAAAYMIARLLYRPDTEDQYQVFIKNIVATYKTADTANFQTSILIILAHLARSKSLPDHVLEIAESAFISNNVHMRKLAMKLTGRISATSDTLQLLFEGLRDVATVVRWSAAKGISRTAPPEIVPFILELFKENAVEPYTDLRSCSDALWQGALLCLSEICRKNKPDEAVIEELERVLPLALTFDIPKGAITVGGHVRDAACYLAWTLARSTKRVPLPIVHACITTACFDREINVRRAASAALQEIVGRQPDHVRHGIDIMTAADFVSVGRKSEAFGSVALEIGRYQEYTIELIKFLMQYSLIHWDPEIRDLASETLALLGPRERKYTDSIVIPELIIRCSSGHLPTRHGALTSLGLLLLQIEVAVDVQNKLLSIDIRRYLKTNGSEYTYMGYLRLMRSMKLQEMQIAILVDAIFYNNPAVLPLALDVVRHLQPKLDIQQFLKALASSNSNPGPALTLVELPLSTIDLDLVISALCTGISSPLQSAEAKVGCVQALKSVAKKGVTEALMLATEDYTNDQRGDVGSWVRIAAMEVLSGISATRFDDHGQAIVAIYLKQACEKIDRVRFCALKSLATFVKQSSSELPGRGQLIKMISNDMIYSSSQSAFEGLVPLLEILCYQKPILTGLIQVVGGMTESMIRESANALFAYIQSISSDQTLAILSSLASIQLDAANRLPWMQTLDISLTQPCIREEISNSLSLYGLLTERIEGVNKDHYRDVKLMLAAGKLLVKFLDLNTSKRNNVMQECLKHLENPLPRIRTGMAEALYMWIMVANLSDEAEVLLTTNKWDQPVTVCQGWITQLASQLDVEYTPRNVIMKKKT